MYPGNFGTQVIKKTNSKKILKLIQRSIRHYYLLIISTFKIEYIEKHIRHDQDYVLTLLTNNSDVFDQKDCWKL